MNSQLVAIEACDWFFFASLMYLLGAFVVQKRAPALYIGAGILFLLALAAAKWVSGATL